MATMKAKAIAAAAFAATAGIASPASAASYALAATSAAKPRGFVPRPATAPGKVSIYNSTSGCAYGGAPFAKVCGFITGRYQYVSGMSLYGCNESISSILVHLEIASPNNTAYLNTTSTEMAPGACTSRLGAIYNEKLPAGEWKFRVWRNDGGGIFTKLVQLSLGVTRSP
jgi:hypothetical protein